VSEIELTDNQKRKLYNEYYSDVSVLFEIVKQLKGREVALLSIKYCVRNIKSHNMAYFKSNLNSFDFFNRFYNVYISSAIYYNMPMFSFDPAKRREQSEKFRNDFKKYMTGYDFFIDIDGKPDELPFEDSDKIIELFESYKVPYSLRISGKGFHFIIPSEYFNFTKNFVVRVDMFKEFVRKIKIIYELKNIDTTVYDLRRVYKVPYSLDVKTMRVCFPLTEMQYELLRKTPNIFHVGNVLQYMKTGRLSLQNRGIKLRNEDFHSQTKVEYMFKDIVEEYFNDKKKKFHT